MIIHNTLHVNVLCSCEGCALVRKREAIYASRIKMTALILTEIRALNGTKKTVSTIAETISGKIEQFLIEEGV